MQKRPEYQDSSILNAICACSEQLIDFLIDLEKHQYQNWARCRPRDREECWSTRECALPSESTEICSHFYSCFSMARRVLKSFPPTSFSLERIRHLLKIQSNVRSSFKGCVSRLLAFRLQLYFLLFLFSVIRILFIFLVYTHRYE